MKRLAVNLEKATYQIPRSDDVEFAALSDKGMVREKNEDSFGIISDNKLPAVFIIADGMGGHNSGEVASKLAVDFAKDAITHLPFASEPNKTLDSICSVMKSANTEVLSAANESQENSGMGTTMLVSVIHNGNLYVAHAGDSRAYLIRNQSISQLTKDHSYIEELVSKGTLTREEAENHPNRHLITRALGCSEELIPDTYSCSLEPEDIILLCTDGLSNMLNDLEMMECLLSSDSLLKACNRLIQNANTKGGEDNATVILIKN